MRANDVFVRTFSKLSGVQDCFAMAVVMKTTEVVGGQEPSTATVPCREGAPIDSYGSGPTRLEARSVQAKERQYFGKEGRWRRGLKEGRVHRVICFRIGRG